MQLNTKGLVTKEKGVQHVSSTADGAAPAAPHRGEIHPGRPTCRHLLVSAVSLGIIAAGVLYVVSPSHEAMALTVREVGIDTPVAAASYRSVLTDAVTPGRSAPVGGNGSNFGPQGNNKNGAGRGGIGGPRPIAPTPTETLYGDLATHDGTQVADAVLTFSPISTSGHGLTTLPGTEVQIGGAGTYRMTLHLRPGSYDVTLSLIADGHRLQSSEQLLLVANRTFEVSATVSADGVFSFLPVSSY